MANGRKNHPLRKREGLYKEMHPTKESKMRWSGYLPFKSSAFLLLLDFGTLCILYCLEVMSASFRET